MRVFSVLAALLLAMVLAPGDARPAQPQGFPQSQRTFGPPPSPPRSLPSPTPSLRPPIVVMSVGDSLSVGHGPDGTFTESYRPELSRLMSLSGQPHTWMVQALGGTKCSYWAQRMGALIDTHHPHLIFLNCGTNDTPTDNTEADYRSILAAAQSRGVPIVASLIMQPDMESPTNIVRPYIWDWHRAINAAILRALAAYPAVPYADMVRVPNNIEWLQADGIHLTARSEAAWGQLFYQAAQPGRGWMSLAQMRQTPMCGLHGHWRGDPWPTPDVAYRVCRS